MRTTSHKIKRCQRRSKALPNGGLKVGHCSGEPFAVAGDVKLVQCVVS